jgi:hypothetical protein
VSGQGILRDFTPRHSGKYLPTTTRLPVLHGDSIPALVDCVDTTKLAPRDFCRSTRPLTAKDKIPERYAWMAGVNCPLMRYFLTEISKFQKSNKSKIFSVKTTWACVDTNLGRVNLNLNKKRIYNFGKQGKNRTSRIKWAILHTTHLERPEKLDLNHDKVMVVFNGPCFDNCPDQWKALGIYYSDYLGTVTTKEGNFEGFVISEAEQQRGFVRFPD